MKLNIKIKMKKSILKDLLSIRKRMRICEITKNKKNPLK